MILHSIALHLVYYRVDLCFTAYFLVNLSSFHFFSLRDSLLEIIKEPIIAADQELTTCKEKLADFADEPEEIHPAWDQYKNFQVCCHLHAISIQRHLLNGT